MCGFVYNVEEVPKYSKCPSRSDAIVHSRFILIHACLFIKVQFREDCHGISVLLDRHWLFDMLSEHS